MRLSIVILMSVGLVMAACSDDTASGTTDKSVADMGAKKDGPVTNQDGPVTKPDMPVPKPDMPVAKPDMPVTKLDAGSKPPCKAWDAKGQGMCSMFLGYVWDGTQCKGISGCSCAGVDCKYIYSSPTLCSKGQSHCGATPSCKPMDVKGVGACKMLLGWYYDGKQCTSLGGCSCAGADCGDLYKTSGDCQSAYKACP